MGSNVTDPVASYSLAIENLASAIHRVENATGFESLRAMRDFHTARRALDTARRAAMVAGFEFEPRSESQLMRSTRAPERKTDRGRAVMLDTVRGHLRASGEKDYGWKKKRFEIRPTEL